MNHNSDLDVLARHAMLWRETYSASDHRTASIILERSRGCCGSRRSIEIVVVIHKSTAAHINEIPADRLAGVVRVGVLDQDVTGMSLTISGC